MDGKEMAMRLDVLKIAAVASPNMAVKTAEEMLAFVAGSSAQAPAPQGIMATATANALADFAQNMAEKGQTVSVVWTDAGVIVKSRTVPAAVLGNMKVAGVAKAAAEYAMDLARLAGVPE